MFWVRTSYHLISHCIWDAAPGTGQLNSAFVAARCSTLLPLLSTSLNKLSFITFFFLREQEFKYKRLLMLHCQQHYVLLVFIHIIHGHRINFRIPFFAAISITSVGSLSPSFSFSVNAKDNNFNFNYNQILVINQILNFELFLLENEHDILIH